MYLNINNHNGNTKNITNICSVYEKPYIVGYLYPLDMRKKVKPPKLQIIHEDGTQIQSSKDNKKQTWKT